jgi:hypothetical protein
MILNLQQQYYLYIQRLAIKRMSVPHHRGKNFSEKILEKKAVVNKSIFFLQDILDGNRPDLKFNTNGDQDYLTKQLATRCVLKYMLSDMLRVGIPVEDWCKKVGINNNLYYNVLKGKRNEFPEKDLNKILIQILK